MKVYTAPPREPGDRPAALDFVWLVVGAALSVLTTWHWNVPIAAWLAPIFLVRFCRRQSRWYVALVALPLLALASFANKRNGWGLDLGFEVLTSTLAILPLLVALFVDRYCARRLSGFWSTLALPATYVALDFALSFAPLGTVFSVAPSQFALKSVVQLASLTGVWGISFLVLWVAPVANLLWSEGPGDRRARSVALFAGLVVVGVLLAGELRLALDQSPASTVRVAGVTIAHPRKYWDEVIDRGTPRDETQRLAPELAALEDSLFAESEHAAAAGAQVIFWSEANAVVLPERREALTARAVAFARAHGVYFVPTYVVLDYGSTTGDNGLLMIAPDGSVAYRYTKTMSWYATDSDGVLRFVDTPFGRIGTAICFDLDFPGFIRQAAQQNVDVMLDPSFDTIGTKPYHTDVGLLRAVDYGFAMVRQVNEGTSAAVDYRGNVLAEQDFFTTPRRVMLADVPTRGTRTLYGLLGDWFAYLSVVVALGTLVAAARVRAGGSTSAVAVTTRPS